MKVKNKLLFVFGIIFLIIGILAYISEKIATFNLKIYGIMVFIIGIIILIDSLIGSSRIYPLKSDEKILKRKRNTKK